MGRTFPKRGTRSFFTRTRDFVGEHAEHSLNRMKVGESAVCADFERDGEKRLCIGRTGLEVTFEVTVVMTVK